MEIYYFRMLEHILQLGLWIKKASRVCVTLDIAPINLNNIGFASFLYDKLFRIIALERCVPSWKTAATQDLVLLVAKPLS